MTTREYDYTNSYNPTPLTRNFVYDGMDIIQERGVVGNANQVTAQLVRDGNISGILSRTTNAGAAFYGYDDNGNVTLLTDNAGQDVGHYRYDAFGNLLEAVGPRASENPYRFSTKPIHERSGLVDYGLRFYSPGMGRWMNRDPLQEEGGINLYAAMGNNAVNSVDEYGEVVETAWDVANLTIGSVSFYHNATRGKYGWAALDAAGIAYDAFATGVPLLPGGAATVIRASRGGAALNRTRAISRIGSGAGIVTGANTVRRNSPASNSFSKKKKPSSGNASSSGNAPRVTSGVTKSNSPIWRGLKGYKGNVKTNGAKGKSRRYYNWDFTHNDIEMYDSAGRHLGSIDGITGKTTKPAVTGRSIDIC